MTPHRPLRRVARAALAVLATTSLVAACGDDDSSDVATDDTETTAAAPASVIEISGAWARTSPKMATAGAVYLEITNDGDLDDALLAASVDPSIAAKVEVHEVVPVEDTSTTMGEGDMGGDDAMGDDGAMGGEGDHGSDGGEMMKMQPVDRIDIPAGQTVVLEPGGYHIMLLDLAAPLEVGTTIELVLTFEEAGDIPVTAEVRDTAP